MKLRKEDICIIGIEKEENEDGFLEVTSSSIALGVEEILLRNILLEFGNYEITAESIFSYEDSNELFTAWVTNLPFELYKQTFDNFTPLKNKKQD